MAGCSVFTRPTFLVNFIEWVIGLVCVICCFFPYCADTKVKVDCIAVTYFGFFIVVCILCISHFMDQPVEGPLMMLTAAVAFVMYEVSGALVIVHYATGDGIVGVVCGVVYFLNIFIAWKFQASFS